MIKYCLAYDDRISQDREDDNDLINKIVTALKRNSAKNLSRPVASTILFEDTINSNRISFWTEVIEREVENEAYYYLCMVAKEDDGSTVERNKRDLSLATTFQEVLDNLP